MYKRQPLYSLAKKIDLNVLVAGKKICVVCKAFLRFVYFSLFCSIPLFIKVTLAVVSPSWHRCPVLHLSFCRLLVEPEIATFSYSHLLSCFKLTLDI